MNASDADSSDFYSERASNPLSNKLNKLLETRLDTDKETLDALKDLSTFFQENTIQKRRNLRSEIEKRSLQVNEEFLHSFRGVKEMLDNLCEDISAMDECCTDMMSRLQTTKSQTHDLINETTKLQAKGQKLQMKSDVADAFLETFHLKPEEIKILRGTQIDESFFDALSRVQTIHSNCKALLRSSQQTAGIEIMEAMALQQETAYERLYRWTQSQCRVVHGSEVSPLLQKALSVLQERPMLFRYSLDEWCGARREALVRHFTQFLTGSNAVCPDDPVRYVSEMLSWLQKAIQAEVNTLTTLLPQQEDEVNRCICHISEGVCRPLRVRVEGLSPPPLLLHRIAALLNSHAQQLSKESSLHTCLTELGTTCENSFQEGVLGECTRLLEGGAGPPGPSLSPPDVLKRATILLRDLLAQPHHSSALQQTVDGVVEICLQSCHLSASQLPQADMAAFLANCLHALHSTLSLFPRTEERIEMLNAQVSAHLDTLVSEQASWTVGQLGLGALYNALQLPPPLSAHPGCDTLALHHALKKLESFLSSPDSLTIPQAGLLHSPSLRSSLRCRSLEVLVSAYRQIHEAVLLPANAYPPLTLLDPETVKETLTAPQQ